MTAPQKANAVQLPPVPQTLQERAIAIAHEESFNPEIVLNVIDAETGGTWDCTKKGNAGEIGCLQIIPKFHPTVDPLNFEESVRYFISESKAGRCWQWTSCNCYSYVSLFVKLPLMQNILANTAPSKGVVAIFQYKVKHVAVVDKLTEDGFWVKEANYEQAKIGKRLIKWDDPHLKGFYAPPTQLALN